MSPRLRVLSGIQPTADSFHLGNYLGALRQWVTLQDSYDAFYCVVDLHAITVPQDPVLLTRRTRVAAAQLLGAGLDLGGGARCSCRGPPGAQHAELAWIPVLHDRVGRGEPDDPVGQGQGGQGRPGAGLGGACSPIRSCQAADILLYQADQVPVGEDVSVEHRLLLSPGSGVATVSVRSPSVNDGS